MHGRTEKSRRERVAGPLLNWMGVNPDSPREEAKHKAQLFFIHLIIPDGF
jgi:hypothetical protein